MQLLQQDKEKGKHKEKIKRRKTEIKYRQYSVFFSCFSPYLQEQFMKRWR
jgi:hypothetical protein